ncbi:MAG: hypothetical protein GKC04_04340 [Methanomicrobiales archaeon]|nr:hypothetical protein [Methanomicrobiales archaeon]
MKAKLFLVLAGALLVCALVCGCTDSQETTGGSMPAAPATTVTPPPSGSAFQTSTSYTPMFTPQGTCYWKVQVDVVNVGTAAATNVRVSVFLVETATGTAGQPKSELFSRFNAGERKIFFKEFPVECSRDYRIEVAIDSD